MRTGTMVDLDETSVTPPNDERLGRMTMTDLMKLREARRRLGMSELKEGDRVWLQCTVEKVYGDSFVIAESRFHVGEEEHVSPAPAGEGLRCKPFTFTNPVEVSSEDRQSALDELSPPPRIDPELR